MIGENRSLTKTTVGM